MTAYDVFVYVLVATIAVTVAPFVLVALLGALAAACTLFLCAFNYLIELSKRAYYWLFPPVVKPPTRRGNSWVN